MSSSQPVAAPNSASRNRLLLVVYTAAIFTSALLLFSVQPLFTKMVLPRLGGSPAVWSVAMVFFQSLLLDAQGVENPGGAERIDGFADRAETETLHDVRR